MPYKRVIYNAYGDKIETLPFKFEVDLDELEKHHNAHLHVTPLDPDTVIALYPYEKDKKEIDPYNFDKMDGFTGDYFYNDEDDEIILGMYNGMDVALFNMCSLLHIGRLDIDPNVEAYDETGFIPVHDKVLNIRLTLEEFKQLDGFVAWFQITQHFIVFKGLAIGSNYIREDVGDGDVVPDFRSRKLSRGEGLFMID